MEEYPYREDGSIYENDDIVMQKSKMNNTHNN